MGLPFDGHVLRYRLRQVDRNGAEEYSPVVQVIAGVPSGNALHYTYPNPARAGLIVRVSFTLLQETASRLTLHDALGREIRTLADETISSGSHAQLIETRGLPSGVYLIQLRADSFSAVRMMQVW